MNDTHTRRSLLLACSLLAGCATLQPGFETPKVQVMGLRPLPGEGMVPRFEILLRVINPNAESLNLRGLSYTVALAGEDIIEGVANDLPSVPGYGEAQVKVLAAVSLLAGARLVADLMQGPKRPVDYELRAKLDVGAMLPTIRIQEKGSLTLR